MLPPAAFQKVDYAAPLVAVKHEHMCQVTGFLTEYLPVLLAAWRSVHFLHSCAMKGNPDLVL